MNNLSTDPSSSLMFGDGWSDSPQISLNGQYVVFSSSSRNLTLDDDNAVSDVFVHDLSTGETVRIHPHSWLNSSSMPSISADGRYISYMMEHTTSIGEYDAIAIVDRVTQEVTEINLARSFSKFYMQNDLSISNDGRYVFISRQVASGTMYRTSRENELFVYDRETNQLRSIQSPPDSQIGFDSSMSGDGSAIAYTYRPVFLTIDPIDIEFGSIGAIEINYGNSILLIRDQATEATLSPSLTFNGSEPNGTNYSPVLNQNGRYLAFVSEADNLVPGDTNGIPDIFVHDREMDETVRVSVASDGTQANGESYKPVLSNDGRYVLFVSEADNLVAGDTNGIPDIFVHDREMDETVRVSVASDGTQANGESYKPVLSNNGRYVLFVSEADNLVPGDTNGIPDIFVHDREMDETVRVSVASDGTEWNQQPLSQSSWIDTPEITADGRYIVFASNADNLFPGDTNEASDVFIHDRITGETKPISVAPPELSVTATDGNDTLNGYGVDNTIAGGLGDDVIFSFSGNDTLWGNEGQDWISGNSGTDSLFGDSGDDTLYGGQQNDTVTGGTGNDLLSGDKGDDCIIGVEPNSNTPGQGEIDTLTGGEGSDIFRLGNSTEACYIGNQDLDYAVVSDFDPNLDILQVPGTSNNYVLKEVLEGGKGTTLSTHIYRLTTGGEDLIAMIKNNSDLSLSAHYFDFL